MREIRAASPHEEALIEARDPGQRASSVQRTARVEPAFAEQAQPLTHQACATFGRVDAVARDLGRRAHHAVVVGVEALTVAVAVHHRAERVQITLRDLSILLTAGRAGNRGQLILLAERRGDLPGVQLIVRIEHGLDALQLAIQHGAEVVRHELGAKALAVLTPKQTAVTRHQLGHGVGDAANARLVFGILQIQRRPHVQAAHVHVPEHAVEQALLVQDRAELPHVGL